MNLFCGIKVTTMTKAKKNKDLVVRLDREKSKCGERKEEKKVTKATTIEKTLREKT